MFWISEYHSTFFFMWMMNNCFYHLVTWNWKGQMISDGLDFIFFFFFIWTTLASLFMFSWNSNDESYSNNKNDRGKIPDNRHNSNIFLPRMMLHIHYLIMIDNNNKLPSWVCNSIILPNFPNCKEWISQKKYQYLAYKYFFLSKKFDDC